MNPLTLEELKALQQTFRDACNRGLCGIQVDSIQIHDRETFHRLTEGHEIVNNGVNGDWVHFHSIVDGVKLVWLAPILAMTLLKR
jgi:hypothetical protein